MDYLNSIISQQNQVQLVEEAIPTLCNRLQHATLSSDRRSAVLGLKSFSRQYRESVVEYGLRALISTLKKDSSNPIIIKAILETLLILFIRGEGDDDLTRGWISQQSRLQNGKYPSPILMDDVSIDHFSLWIADEVTQDEECISLLLEILLENDNFHIRLYALQLLEALVSTRGEKTKDCLLNLPTAISTLVSLLNDSHDPVRNEAILLLMAIANRNFNIQKLVAFENTFDSLFDIIDEEGGIRGSILVQDCLTLITNLLQYNASNQKLFLETQCIPRLAKLLGEPVEDVLDDGLTDENGIPIAPPPMIWTEQRIQNMITALEICKILVSEDNESLEVNQDKLFRSGVSFIVLKLVFSPVTINSVRSVALFTTADLIRGNSDIQLEFSQIDVPYIDPSMPTQLKSYDKPVPVTIALLNWALFINSVHVFDIRMGAAWCLHAYFKDNNESKSAFLSDQIKAYADPDYFAKSFDEDEEEKQGNGDIESENKDLKDTEVQIEKHPELNGNLQSENTIPTPFGNIFATLMDYDADIKLNPYRLWFAAIILIFLFEENEDNKETARNVQTGDESAGEEVMSSIQAISGLLVTTLDNMDPRISIGYLMVLTVWLYEDFNAVNDFLSDSSVVKSILAFLSNNSSELTELVHGMATILLGVLYEFSSKESPISRIELHSILVKAMGKDNYSLKVKQFKENDLFKNFDDESPFNNTKDQTGLPDVYFESIYVNLIKENFPRIKKALFHDPNAEPQGRISFELYEELDTQHNLLKEKLKEESNKANEAEKKLKEEINKLVKDCEELKLKLGETSSDLDKLQIDYSTISEKYENTSKSLQDTNKSKKEFEMSSEKYYRELQDALKKSGVSGELVKTLEAKLEISEQAKQKAEDGINKMSRELFHLSKQKKESEGTIKSLEKQIASLKAEIASTTKSFQSQIEKLQKANELFKQKINDLNNKLAESISYNEHSDKKSGEMEEKLAEVEATNEHLMDKLRSAASAFQEMKSAKTVSDEEIEKFKIEIRNKTDELANLKLDFEKLGKDKEVINNDFEAFKESSASEIAKLTSDIVDLRSTKAALDENHTNISKEFDELKVSLSEKTQAYDNLKLDYDKKLQLLKSENETLKKDLKEIGDSKVTSEDNYKQIEKELGDLRSKHQMEVKDLEKSLNSKLDEHNKALEELKNKDLNISSLKDGHTKNISELMDKHTKLTDELKEARTLHSETEKQLKEKLESYSSLSDQMSSLEKEKNDLQTSLKKAEEASKSSIEELKKEKDQLNDKILNMETEKSSYEGVLNNLQKEKASADEELAKLNTIADTKVKLDNEVTELRAGAAKLKEERDAIETKLNGTAKELDTTKVNFKEQESKVGELTVSLEKEQIAVKTLREEKDLLEKKINDLETEIKSTKKKSDDVQKENESLQAKLKSTEKDFSTQKAKFTTEASALKEQISEHELNISNLKADLQKKVQEVEKERNMLNKNSETVIKEYGDKIKELEKALEDSKSNHESKLSSIQKEKRLVNENLQSIKQEFEDYKVENKEAANRLKEESMSLNDKLVSERKLAASKLSEREAELIKESNDLKAAVEKLNSELEKFKKDAEEAKSSLETRNKEFSRLEEDLKSKVKTIDSLNKDVGSNNLKTQDLKDKNGKLEKDLEGIRKSHNESTETISSLNKIVEELKVLNSNLEEKWNNKVKDAESECAALEEQKKILSQELSALKSSDKAASEMTKQLESEIQNLKDNIEENEQCKNDLEQKTSEFTATIKKLESDAEIMQKELESERTRKKELATELKDNDKLSAELEVCKEKIKQLEKDHEQVTNSLHSKESGHKGKIKELESTINSLQVQLEDFHKLKDESEKLKEEAKSTKIAKEAEIEKLNKDLLSNKLSIANEKELKEKLDLSKESENKLKEELNSSKKSETRLNEEIQSLKSTMESKDSEVKALKSNESLFLENEKKLKEETEVLKKKLKDQASSMVPKSELDDLMLLMSDIDERNKKYKKQLKALGQEVSSDEESDDDDDEDDDDEDDEDEEDEE